MGQGALANAEFIPIQYRSIFYLFEFDPSSGALTVKDNYKGWSTTIDTGVSGLIVPAGTGGGPVVVYEKQKAVYGALVHWESGAVKERIALGTGTLLHAGFTLRGSYGANGTALIQTSQTAAENVSFTLDLWGDVGSTGVKAKAPLPSGSPLPPVPAPGFPGGGMSATSTACDEGDCDRDGFSDEFERVLLPGLGVPRDADSGDPAGWRHPHVRGGSTATQGRARIRVAGGDGSTRAVEIAGSTTIGRAGGNVLILTDPEVSSVHAVIEVTPQGCVIRDLGSANGTTVNGQRVSEAALRPGDEVGVGATRILFDG